MRSLTLISVFFATTTSLAAQSHTAVYDSAYVAWRRGHYPQALAQLERILTESPTAATVGQIALLTGERYRTVEVAPDGTAPTWSPDGRFAAYQTGTGAEAQVHVLTMHPSVGRRILVTAGARPVFSGDGRVAIMQVVRADQLDHAVAELRQSVRDFRDFQRFRQEAERLQAEHTHLTVITLATGRSERIAPNAVAIYDAAFGPDDALYVAAGEPGMDGVTNFYRMRDGQPEQITQGGGVKREPRVVLDGTHLAFRTDGGIAIHDLSSGRARTIAGSDPVVSANGRMLAYLTREADTSTINVLALGSTVAPSVVHRTTDRVAGVTISANGRRLAWQQMPREDWEIFVAEVGSEPRRLTHEIQHDLFPQFLTDDLILAVIGEGRHRRSYLHDFATGGRTRLFHNNTLRTVAPEYEWAASPDASKVLIVSERDGDTISPERGVYLVDLTQPLRPDEILARVREMRNAEEALRARGERMFAPAADAVRSAVEDVSKERIYRYASDLFAFGSKWIARPGNAKAIEYLSARLREFGYEPELHWFDARGQRSANVIATLRGTAHPDVTYVVSSHFDSVNGGPGADDNSSGTTALLEAARVLARRPQTATIQFAFFTGEEAGLLGSREFVRRAVADNVKLVGALNNDMIGYANDERLDNTIRYSNAGIRDLQHAAGFLFTDLILYDAKYYKSTDAHAYYDAYGDIVGGIGSYPILGNPHYHQEHDVLETINQQLVAEVSKTTVASIMLMASSPSRLTGLRVEEVGGRTMVTWTPAVEDDVVRYRVTWGPEHDPGHSSRDVASPRIELGDLPAGTRVRIKAVNRRGLESWDWAGVTLNH